MSGRHGAGDGQPVILPLAPRRPCWCTLSCKRLTAGAHWPIEPLGSGHADNPDQGCPNQDQSCHRMLGDQFAHRGFSHRK
jgi:hypothetical protein